MIIIIESLYADSDLLNKYDTDCEIINTSTIKEFIDDNKKIYRDLSYDPYNIDNIDNKGKSYLKWCSPFHGLNLSIAPIREIYKVYTYNVSINVEVNKTQDYYSSFFMSCFVTQIIGICLLFIIVILSFIFTCGRSNEEEKNTIVILFLYSFFMITSIVTFIISIVNVSKLDKKIDETVYSLNEKNIYSLKVFNFINLFGNGLMILIYILLIINSILEYFSTSLCKVITDLLVKKEDKSVSKDDPIIPNQETNKPNIEFRTMDEINGGFNYD